MKRVLFLLVKFANDLQELALPNTLNPKLEGRKITIMFRPTKKKNEKNG